MSAFSNITPTALNARTVDELRREKNTNQLKITLACLFSFVYVFTIVLINVYILGRALLNEEKN